MCRGGGADEGVGINAVLRKRAFCQLFEVYLMDNTDAERHDEKGIEVWLSPF